MAQQPNPNGVTASIYQAKPGPRGFRVRLVFRKDGKVTEARSVAGHTTRSAAMLSAQAWNRSGR